VWQGQRAQGIEVNGRPMSQCRVQLSAIMRRQSAISPAVNQLNSSRAGKAAVAIKGIVEQSQRPAPHLLDGESTPASGIAAKWPVAQNA